MRPIPPHSTDLTYSSHFRQEDLEEVCNALGYSDIKMVTTATLASERVLYHACLNGIQTYVKMSQVDEAGRAEEIAVLADGMYAKLHDEYCRRVERAKPILAAKQNEAGFFCEQIERVESGKRWDPVRFNNTWNIIDYPPRWQKKAIEAYGTIRSRMETGDYSPRQGETPGSLTAYWTERNLEYKHYRDIGRSMVEEYIQQNFTSEKMLTMHPASDRLMTLFIGSMGSGKSEMTRHYLKQLPDDVRQDLVLHNADYLKYALYKSAHAEGMLPADHQYAGPEVQAESSNALYEGTRKRGYLARQKFEAPNVVLNSIVLGSFEVLEGIASGGKVVAHHISISKEEAIKEADVRRKAGGRAPSATDVGWSTAASANSLLLLTQPQFRETDITVHLYERHAGKAPAHYGTIDAAKSMMYVHDVHAFAEMCHCAFPQMNEEEALRAYTEKFLASGFTLAITKDAQLSEPVAVIDSQKKMVISDIAAFEGNVAHRNVLRDMALGTQLGGTIQIAPAEQKGGLRALR
jgi:hypothetical protein